MKNKFVDFKVLATSLCCSVVMGLISFAFLKCLDYAADFRSFFPLCYMFLPVAGIVTAFVYKRIGGKSSMGCASFCNSGLRALITAPDITIPSSWTANSDAISIVLSVGSFALCSMMP